MRTSNSCSSDSRMPNAFFAEPSLTTRRVKGSSANVTSAYSAVEFPCNGASTTPRESAQMQLRHSAGPSRNGTQNTGGPSRRPIHVPDSGETCTSPSQPCRRMAASPTCWHTNSIRRSSKISVRAASLDSGEEHKRSSCPAALNSCRCSLSRTPQRRCAPLTLHIRAATIFAKHGGAMAEIDAAVAIPPLQLSRYSCRCESPPKAKPPLAGVQRF